MALLIRTLLAAALAATATAASAEVAIKDAWIRATQPGAANGAGYATVTNSGPGQDRLLSVSTPVAGMSHLHQSITKNGMASMKAVTALDLPARKAVTLAPGGYHIMLMGLKKPLAVGDRVQVTLTFEKAGKKNVAFEVRDGAPMAGMHHH